MIQHNLVLDEERPIRHSIGQLEAILRMQASAHEKPHCANYILHIILKVVLHGVYRQDQYIQILV